MQTNVFLDKPCLFKTNNPNQLWRRPLVEAGPHLPPPAAACPLPLVLGSHLQASGCRHCPQTGTEWDLRGRTSLEVSPEGE